VSPSSWEVWFLNDFDGRAATDAEATFQARNDRVLLRVKKFALRNYPKDRHWAK
jgi:hypothetical protein